MNDNSLDSLIGGLLTGAALVLIVAIVRGIWYVIVGVVRHVPEAVRRSPDALHVAGRVTGEATSRTARTVGKFVEGFKQGYRGSK